MYENLSIEKFRQFSEVYIRFHPRLTVLVGANGAGKSTILKFLAQHLGWGLPLMATPVFSKTSDKKMYSTGLYRSQRGYDRKIGFVRFSGAVEAKISAPTADGVEFLPHFSQEAPFVGMLIASPNQFQTYRRTVGDPGDAKTSVLVDGRDRYQILLDHHQQASLDIRRFLLEGLCETDASSSAAQSLRSFSKVIRRMLPRALGFKEFRAVENDVVLLTDSGEFVLEACSSGILTIIDLSYQIFSSAPELGRSVVLIDEPENHLHPSMQREILSNLLAAFPNQQFIVATHSPLVVSSVRDSFVYALEYREGLVPGSDGIKRNIISREVTGNDKIGTASEVYRDTFGVLETLPIFIEREIEKISSDFVHREINADTIAEIRNALKVLELEDRFLETLKNIAEQR